MAVSQSSNNKNLQQILNSENVRKRFDEMLGESAGSFISTILTIVNSNNKLKECTTGSILSAAATAAALKLPINPSLGLAHIIPFKVNSQYLAQFQLGWRGYVQLAMRSGQYRRINTSAVYEGQIRDIDFVTGDIVRGEKVSDEIVGYVAFFELLNGFSKVLYMTNEEIIEHAKKYSMSYSADLKYGKKSSLWTTSFPAMAQKTVLKLLLSRFGIISVDSRSTDMALALRADQSVITQDGTYRYIDNERDDTTLIAFSDVVGLQDYTADGINSDEFVQGRKI